MGKLGKFLHIALLSWPLCAHAQGLDSVVARLQSITDYSAPVRYAVTLPQAEDDVVYTLQLQSHTPADLRLCPADYLIDWSVDTPSGTSTGFSAYFDGHHYRLRGDRLQEYHMEWDSVPMLGDGSVQRRTQFASLLPQFVAEELTRMASDPEHYSMSVKGSTVKAQRLANGNVDAELLYEFDPATGAPTLFEAEYNPSAISSQTVRATYGQPLANTSLDLSEALLRQRYPEAFERMRQSNFAIENLPGHQLPAFSLPLAGSNGRLTREASGGFDYPTAVVLMEADGALTPYIIKEVRAAVDRLPQTAAVVWAFAGRDPDAALEALGEVRSEEQAVTGARSLAADCGAASLPVVLVCDKLGTVRHVAVGVNNQLSTDVIRMLTLSSELRTED